MKKGHKFPKARRKNGQGSFDSTGRKLISVEGNQILESRYVAEKILGKKLPPDAVVHHVDNDPSNNAPTNLVICPDPAYHRLLHERMKAMDACGDPNKRRCCFCKEWDDLENMYRNNASFTQYHRVCRQKQRYQQVVRPA